MAWECICWKDDPDIHRVCTGGHYDWGSSDLAACLRSRQRENSSEQAGEISSLSRELLFPGAPLTMTDANLPGALNVYSPLVVDCWERGCRPCELLDPKINQMAADFKGRIVFAKVCIDDNPETMIKYGVERTPTLLIFNNSNMVYKHVGNFPIDDLKHIILTVLHMR